MRRSGSSSCMLRPKSEVDLTNVAEESLSVTLINKQSLPLYSSERFYLLSELEVNGYATVFLCDHNTEEEQQECDETQDTVESSEASVMEPATPVNPKQAETAQSSPFIILYMLWRPNGLVSTVEDFVSGPIQTALKHTKHYLDTTALAAAEASSRSTATAQHSAGPQSWYSEPCPGGADSSPISIYLVIDILVPVPSNTFSSIDTDNAQRHQRFQAQVRIAENLARHLSRENELRSTIEGITIGVSDHERAAPGLEACVEAVSVGARLRRKHGKTVDAKKSLLQVTSPYPDDLLGAQSEQVTDAVQGVLQCRIIAEWNGLGNLKSFARRAQAGWLKQHDVLDDDAEEKLSLPLRRRSRRRARLEELDAGGLPAAVSTIAHMMIMLVFVHVGLSLWNIYGDELMAWYESEFEGPSSSSVDSVAPEVESAMASDQL